MLETIIIFFFILEKIINDQPKIAYFYTLNTFRELIYSSISKNYKSCKITCVKKETQ